MPLYKKSVFWIAAGAVLGVLLLVITGIFIFG